MGSSDLAIRESDVRAAAQRLAGHAVHTPLLESPALNARVGRRVLLKFEGAQHTGSFKFRGAYNRLAQLVAVPSSAPSGSSSSSSNGGGGGGGGGDDARGHSVVAFSSGNHAQGVAAAAAQLGLRATIVMPADAPAIKAAGTRAYGARVVTYDRERESREDIARALVAGEPGAVLVPSFDDPHVMAGQGTVGAEVVAQAAACGARVHTLLCPVSGGGLLAGVATAVAPAAPQARMYSVEPAAHDDLARSLRSGARETNSPSAAATTALCDALLAPAPGHLTLPILSTHLAGGLVVSDAQVRYAVRYAFHTLKLVVEPGGAVGLAAVLAGLVPAPAPAPDPDHDHDHLQAQDAATVVILSGSNVDPALFARIIQEDEPAPERKPPVHVPASSSAGT